MGIRTRLNLDYQKILKPQGKRSIALDLFVFKVFYYWALLFSNLSLRRQDLSALLLYDLFIDVFSLNLFLKGRFLIQFSFQNFHGKWI